MSFESLTEPIESENNQERERELEKRILLTQLMLIEKQVKPGESEYIDLLIEYTHIVGILWQCRYRCEFKNNELVKEKDLKEIEKRSRKETRDDLVAIAENSSGEDRVSKIFDYIQQAFLKWPAFRNEPSPNLVGLIRFEQVDARYFRGVPGLGVGDSLLQIHFDPAYFKKDGVGPAELKAWFSQIAELIVGKYPETRAVVGRSWLLSHPLMKRLGFQKIDNKTEKMSGGAYWDQLITKDGQIDPDKVSYLNKHGKLPFDISSGYIMIEDFLGRYLPKEKKGKIKLKRVDPERVKQHEAIRQEVEDGLKKNWDKAINEQLSANFLLEKIPGFVAIARSVGLEDDLRRFFQMCIDRKIDLKTVKENEDLKAEFEPTMNKISEELKKLLESVEYETEI